MSNYRLEIVRRDSSVESAVELYKSIIDFNKMDKHTVEGWSGIYLSYLSDPEGWLGVWMLKTDELFASMFGCRFWDVIYVKDNSCVQAIRPVNRENAYAAYADENILTYDKFPLADKSNIPDSLAYVMTNFAFRQTLEVKGLLVNIKPVSGFYDIGPEFGNNSVLPFQDEVSLRAIFYNNFIIASNKASGISVDHAIPVTLD